MGKDKKNKTPRGPKCLGGFKKAGCSSKTNTSNTTSRITHTKPRPEIAFPNLNDQGITQQENVIQKNILSEMKELKKWLQEEDVKNTSDTTNPLKDDEYHISQSWSQRKESITKEWTLLREKILNHFISFQASSATDFCNSCSEELNVNYIRCNTCKMNFCSTCDRKLHSKQMFHQRIGFFEREKTFFKPNEFFAEDKIEEIIKEEIFVPCYLPRNGCKNCYSDTLALTAGDRNIIIVTVRGRFDMKSCAFQCSTCKGKFEAKAEDYVSSGYWPAQALGGFYYFSEEVLQLWNNLKYNSPGTSESKFIETLQALSLYENRIDVINKVAFHNASREYELLCHTIDIEIRKMRKAHCKACGDQPLACHCDGNLKLYRYALAGRKNENGRDSIYKDYIIALDEKVSTHINILNKAVNEVHLNWPVYKAAKKDSSRLKNLDETGIVVCCCRHGVVLNAANMHVGETFRHTHFIHNEVARKDYKFFCSDVACAYWKFAEKIGMKLPAYKNLTMKMKAFLGRMHGKTHVWTCQILYNGTWISGSAATTGEEQEQVNAILSRYGNVTKHMSKDNRRDHLTGGILYNNSLKEKRMPSALAKRLSAAREKLRYYERKLHTQMPEREITEKNLEAIHKKLHSVALMCHGKRMTNNLPLDIAQNSLEGYYYMIQVLRRRIKVESDSSRSRSNFRHKITTFVKKAKALIKRINTLKQNEHQSAKKRKYLKISKPINEEDSEENLSDEDEDSEDYEEESENTKDTDDDENESSETSDSNKFESSENETSEAESNQNKGKSLDSLNLYMDYEKFQKGTFPWLPTSANNFQEDYEIVDTWMLTKRYNEEIVQVKLEMTLFLQETRKTVDTLKFNRQTELRCHECSTKTQNARAIHKGKAFIMAEEETRLKKILSSCTYWFNENLHSETDE